MNIGDVWFVNFPLEDDPTQSLNRPVLVLDIDSLEVLSVKVTTTPPRPNDVYDTPIVYWEAAKLRFKSTARVSKTIYLPKSQFKFKIGELHPDDLSSVQDALIRFIEDQG